MLFKFLTGQLLSSEDLGCDTPMTPDPKVLLPKHGQCRKWAVVQSLRSRGKRLLTKVGETRSQTEGSASRDGGTGCYDGGKMGVA